MIITLYRKRFYFRSPGLLSLYREYRYFEDRYIGVLSHKFHSNFCLDIEYSSLYGEHRYIEDRYIGVPLYCFCFWLEVMRIFPPFFNLVLHSLASQLVPTCPHRLVFYLANRQRLENWSTVNSVLSN